MFETTKYAVGSSGFRSMMVLLCLVTIGCGNNDAWHVATVPVQGKIRINAEPPKGAVLTLYPTGPEVDIRESKPWGVVDQDGVYRLRTYGKDDGAPTGQYAVTLVWRENPSIPGSPDMLRGAYADPARSEWKVTIEEGQGELPTIEVTGAEVKQPSKRAFEPPSPFDDPVIGR